MVSRKKRKTRTRSKKKRKSVKGGASNKHIEPLESAKTLADGVIRKGQDNLYWMANNGIWAKPLSQSVLEEKFLKQNGKDLVAHGKSINIEYPQTKVPIASIKTSIPPVIKPIISNKQKSIKRNSTKGKIVEVPRKISKKKKEIDLAAIISKLKNLKPAKSISIKSKVNDNQKESSHVNSKVNDNQAKLSHIKSKVNDNQKILSHVKSKANDNQKILSHIKSKANDNQKILSHIKSKANDNQAILSHVKSRVNDNQIIDGPITSEPSIDELPIEEEKLSDVKSNYLKRVIKNKIFTYDF